MPRKERKPYIVLAELIAGDRTIRDVKYIMAHSEDDAYDKYLINVFYKGVDEIGRMAEETFLREHDVIDVDEGLEGDYKVYEWSIEREGEAYKLRVYVGDAKRLGDVRSVDIE